MKSKQKFKRHTKKQAKKKSSIHTKKMTSTQSTNTYDVVIIGSGPAGYTAGIYTARGMAKTLILTGEQPGGQLTTTTEIENFPGFKTIEGFQLMANMEDQAIHNGCKVVYSAITSIIKNSNDGRHNHTKFRVIADNGEIYDTKSIIIASGGTANRLDFAGAEEFWNYGISACAVCDGAAPIFRNKPIFVIGGGDSAMEEALFLARYGSSVTVLVRSAKLRASAAMIRKAAENSKITIEYNTEVVAALSGDGDNNTGEKHTENKKNKLVGNIKTINNITAETQVRKCAGIFFAVGHKPNTAFLGDLVKLNERGFIVRPDSDSMATSCEGIFVAGDVADEKYRQAITAAGSGCMASLEVLKYLD